MGLKDGEGLGGGSPQPGGIRGECLSQKLFKEDGGEESIWLGRYGCRMSERPVGVGEVMRGASGEGKAFLG